MHCALCTYLLVLEGNCHTRYTGGVDKEGKLSYRGSKGREIVMGQLVMGCPRRRGQRSVDVDISLFVTPFLITAPTVLSQKPSGGLRR